MKFKRRFVAGALALVLSLSAGAVAFASSNDASEGAIAPRDGIHFPVPDPGPFIPRPDPPPPHSEPCTCPPHLPCPH